MHAKPTSAQGKNLTRAVIGSLFWSNNAQLAHQVFIANPQAGLLLSCNVIVEDYREGETIISFIISSVMLSLGEIGENKKISELAAEVEKRLILVADRLFV